jgi:phenylacetic acid degradation operon negative regulatory protein
MEAFGADDRVVRTSIFRLTKEGWLTPSAVGRRRYYALTKSGRHRFHAAHRQIYSAGIRPWKGEWTFVLIGLHESSIRETLRRDLAWQGFGQAMPGFMLHPSPDQAALHEALSDAKVAADVVVMKARADDFVDASAIRDLIARSWDIPRLSAGYGAFMSAFAPVLESLTCSGLPDVETCFRLRILLIHAYRKALLRDPMLPDDLLPSYWLGAQARALCRDIYLRLREPADQFFLWHAETIGGPLTTADSSYHARFELV